MPPEQFTLELDLSIEENLPHLEQYFGVWAMLEEPFRAACLQLNRLDLRAHLQSEAAEQARSAGSGMYQVVRGNIAVVPLSGPLMKHTSSMTAGSSTVLARRQLRAAAADGRVKMLGQTIDDLIICLGTKSSGERAAALLIEWTGNHTRRRLEGIVAEPSQPERLRRQAERALERMPR